MAAGLLWILDASINISMEPFRAFVADKLPEQQRGTGFAMQSFFIGVGAFVAGMLPYLLRNWFGVSTDAGGSSAVPVNVRISFYIGAAAFLGAVLWTVISTPENPPADLEAFRRKQRETRGVGHLLREIADALIHMPKTMRRLALVQFFTWMGLFCMWLHFSNAVPVIFGSSDPTTDVFKRGAEWAGTSYAIKDGVTFLAAFVLIAAANRVDRRRLHAVCLTLGAIGLLAVGSVHGEGQRHLLWGAMVLGGIAWASILSMPYAILAGALPPGRMGIYMGIFNFFIVLPEILASLFFGGLVKTYLHGNIVQAVMAGGVFMLIAAALVLLVPKETEAASVALAEDATA
jgi:maltose/moltooligosaccharide transporter